MMKPHASHEKPMNQPHWLANMYTESQEADAPESKHQEDGTKPKHDKKKEEPKAKEHPHKKPKAASGEENETVDKKKAEKLHVEDEKEAEEKKEKRADIVERSQRLAEAYEDTPPHDPATLARLLIAHHILELHQEIEEPKSDAVLDKEELLHVFDYMGELADKFEHPEEESSDEIEEAYTALLHLAEDAVREHPEEDIETIVAVNKAWAGPTEDLSSSHAENTFEPVSVEPMPQSQSSAGATLISALATVRSAKKSQYKQVRLASFSKNESTDKGADAAHYATAPDTSTPQSVPSAHLSATSSPVEARQAYRAAARAEHTIRPLFRSRDKIASLAVASAFVAAAHENHGKTTETSPLAPQPARTTAPTSKELVSTTYAHAISAAKTAETFKSRDDMPHQKPSFSPSSTVHF